MGKNIFITVLIIAGIFLVFTVLNQNTGSDVPRYTYAELLRDLENGNVLHITITPDGEAATVAVATVMLSDGRMGNVHIPSLDIFLGIAHEALGGYPSPSIATEAPSRPSLFMRLLPTILMFGMFIILMIFMMNRAQGGAGGGDKAFTFGRSRARIILPDAKRITFDKVAGLIEEKDELAQVVDFLKDPHKYTEMGARIPRGILLVGPPGTGKTYLARAVAGEAGVPFFSISGSDFVEMFVGVGASRVRDLFQQAKRSAPSIIMIDEIDAVGRKRGAGLGGGHDEREQTLNQMLVEMDGFTVNEGVIVLAATNRPDILDPALLRPGRFDRRIVVNRPDVKGREAVLGVHAASKKMGTDVSLATVAQTTPGFTPADLENLLNESALLAAKENKMAIDMDAIRRSFIKVGIGTEKKSRVISEKERRMTAYHEAGHAILFELLPEIDSTYIVSLIPTGNAGGYVMPLPGEDRYTVSKRRMEQEIIAVLGGRAAEELVLNDITTGASSDIERATAVARNMVVRYGMSDKLGPIRLGSDNDEVFLGRDIAQTKNYSESVAEQIDSEIKRIVDHAYAQAKELLNTHMSIMHQIVDLLMVKERVTGEEVRSLFPMGVLPDKGVKGKVL